MSAMTTTTTRLLTADNLLEMPEVPGKRFELVRGALIEMPGTIGEHGYVVMELGFFLRGLPGVRDRGFVFGDSVSYILARNPDTVRIPDVSFVRHERLPRRGALKHFLPVGPDLAVEVVSESDRAVKLHEKVQEYFSAGTSVVWLFWPTTREVEVVTPDGVTRRLGPDDDLVTPDFLPDGRIRVSELFPPSDDDVTTS